MGEGRAPRVGPLEGMQEQLPTDAAVELTGKYSQGDLSEMSLSELQSLSALIESDVFDVLTLEGSVSARNHFGGTAPDQVRAAIIRARQRLA